METLYHCSWIWFNSGKNINTGKIIEFEIIIDKIEAIYMILGWTYNIINLSIYNDLVTVMTCNKVFASEQLVLFEPVKYN